MAEELKSDISEQQRVIRVFVSSTFRDMHAERDHLVRFVFPWAFRSSLRLATENGLDALAEQIKPILDSVRSKLP